MIDESFIRDNIARVRDTLDAMGRADVTLIAATKTQPKETVDFVLENGLADAAGENRVQEFLDKYEEKNKDKRQFIGRLQTNKVKYLLGKCALIQSLDSIKLAEEIQRLAQKRELCVDCLAEVNVGGEASKGGVLLEDLDDFLDALSDYKRINVVGLMGVVPKSDDKKYVASLYEKLGRKYADVKDKRGFKALSAGMSGDWVEAVKYAGADTIRLGTAIFGKRV